MSSVGRMIICLHSVVSRQDCNPTAGQNQLCNSNHTDLTGDTGQKSPTATQSQILHLNDQLGGELPENGNKCFPQGMTSL